MPQGDGHICGRVVHNSYTTVRLPVDNALMKKIFRAQAFCDPMRRRCAQNWLKFLD
jgi:hypothetical protein